MIFSYFRRWSFQNVFQPWWTVYIDFSPVAAEVTSNLLSLAWRLRLDPIVGWNAPKPKSHLCKPTACLSSQMCHIRAQVHCTVPIKISNYPLSIFFLDPLLTLRARCNSSNNFTSFNKTPTSDKPASPNNRPHHFK